MIDCTITSPKETTVYKNVQSVTLPAFSGQMQILPDHAEAFILLQEGDIFIQELDKEDEKTVHVTNGECYVKDNVVTVIL